MLARKHVLVLIITVVISLILSLVVFPIVALGGYLLGGWCPPMLGVHIVCFILWLIGFGYYGYVETKEMKGGI
ncbi:MAG: hypothetical protein QXO15_09140 [Nitrososphaerota archaeon]